MKQPQGPQIVPQVLERNSERVEKQPLTKHTTQSGIVKVSDRRTERGWSPAERVRRMFEHKARLVDERYGQRAVVEPTVAAIAQRFGEMLRAKTGFDQFHELVLDAGVFDVISALATETDVLKPVKPGREIRFGGFSIHV